MDHVTLTRFNFLEVIKLKMAEGLIITHIGYLNVKCQDLGSHFFK